MLAPGGCARGDKRTKSGGFFFFITALNEFFLRTLLTVSEEMGVGMMVLM